MTPTDQIRKEDDICDGFQGPCTKKGKMRNQNTAYLDEFMNIVFMCDECFSLNEEHWNDMWRDYYQGRI